MPKIFSLGNHNFKSPNECGDLSPVTADLREKNSTFCDPHQPDPCQEVGRKKKFGEKVDCDPLQSGAIVNDVTKPARNVINRYSKSIRGSDEGMLDLFSNLVVIDEDSKVWPVPIIWGTQERAAAYVLQNNMRKDNTLVVDRLPLPLLAIHSSDVKFARERYIYHKAQSFLKEDKTYRHVQELKPKDTVFGISMGVPVDISYSLYAWTLYIEDMNQLLEQIVPKLTPMAYIRVQGIPWEIGVTLDSIANNIDFEPGDKKERVIKYKFDMTVQTFISQPITRNKTVLKIKTDFHNSIDASEVIDVFNRDEVE
ncbi:MAG: hypothetical protein DWQ19_11665 [Crenarchaeota archaeon]|nr:MAG: hypothetical protein DWQ19_11665 [Thermoproteota archaeon]